jgi:hypothetical protein
VLAFVFVGVINSQYKDAAVPQAMKEHLLAFVFVFINIFLL